MSFESILCDFEKNKKISASSLTTVIKKLINSNIDIPNPGSGETYRRWQILAQIAATNLNLAKWFESHLDAISILHEIGVINIPNGLLAVWAAEGSPNPIIYENGYCKGTKLWCSGSDIVDYGLMTFKNENGHSQLCIVDMSQQDIFIDHQDWHAVGMGQTRTASINFNNISVEKVGKSNQYLTRVGFWHGAAGIAACWYGATARLAEFLHIECQLKPNHFKLMYAGEINTALAATQMYFKELADKIDHEPFKSHELEIRILRAQVENTANLTLELVGKALGAGPFCQNAIFSNLTADLPVFLRQSHAAFDFECIAKLTLMEQKTWNL